MFPKAEAIQLTITQASIKVTTSIVFGSFEDSNEASSTLSSTSTADLVRTNANMLGLNRLDSLMIFLTMSPSSCALCRALLLA